ncbi:MAG: DUF4445 domain-containing protein [Actinobacteria bacterium]|nr:MAG: DUF4445 domain-containing protein [Actinomycetota bacterium]
MPKVTFLPDNITVEVAQGENLLRAAMAAEVHISATCGGRGVCGKCRVIVEDSEGWREGGLPSRANSKVEHDGNPQRQDPELGLISNSYGNLTEEEIQKGYRLACLCTVEGDVTVRIPVEARRGEREVLERLKEAAAYGVMLTEEDVASLVKGVTVDPAVKKVYLEVAKPDLANNADDLTRLRQAAKAAGYKELEVDFLTLTNLSEVLREQDFKVTATFLKDHHNLHLVRVEPGDTTKSNLGVAFDIGTTTLFVQLLDLNTGEALSSASDYNPQISFGEDVITRIIYSLKGDGLKKLQETATKAFMKLATEALEKAKRKSEEISLVSAAGNTTMAHLFLGVSPKNIRQEPYIPVVTHWPHIRPQEIGISNLASGSQVFMVPGRASYVGGDITAGVLASGMYNSDKLTLYIDVGTNGEIVLGNKEWLMTCACSAGPAFEGGSIKHGMRATIGAIEQVRINWEDHEPMILTIGNKPPAGLCGSGLIDSLAELFLAKVIDPRGKFHKNLETKRVREGKSGWEYVLAEKEMAATDYDITITEVDIDNLMRAKAAVYAGITTLLDNVGVGVDQVEEFFIAGGFGHYLELDKAIIIGMFPQIEGSKVKFLGNGSLMGARLAAISAEMADITHQIANKMTYLELSVDPAFMERYTAALFLPHTEVSRFPMVEKLMLQS